MITRLTKDNAAQYRYLYDKAEALLKEAGVMTEFIMENGQPTEEVNRITSLEEYFSYIKDLTQLDKHFTMLPLDEEVFEIDLNTRQITVPPSFAKNGISVQGDEVAEIIYFKSDRFFDATDLAPDADDTDDDDVGIYIQWESSAKDENGQPITGVSVPWIIDRDTIPYHILIGWPLSSKVTQAAGTIKFSVRFFKYDKNKQKIVYSLSTLVQTAQIKPSLDYNLEEIIPDGSLIDDSSALIINRAQNTAPSNLDYKAEMPEILGYFVKKDGVNFVPVSDEDFLSQNLAKDANNFTTLPIYLGISAISADAGRLTYSWVHRPYDANGQILPEEGGFESKATLEMVVTTDTERVPGKLYYEKVEGSNPPVYRIYNRSLVDSGEPEADPVPAEIFEQISMIPAVEAGTYFVDITNRVNKASNNIISSICEVPAPKAPIIDEDLPERLVLRPEEYVGTLAITAHPEEADGKLTYKWVRQPIEGELENLVNTDETAAANEWTIDGLVEDAFVGDGSYRVEVTNNLNKLQNMIQSKWCRVTHAASVPFVNRADTTAMNVLYNIASTSGISITAKVLDEAHENRTEEDELIYEWYMYDNTQLNHDADRARAEANVTVNRYEKKASDTRVFYGQSEDEPQGPTLILPQNRPDLAGHTFFCVVTNKYNGDTASICSPFIDIIQ